VIRCCVISRSTLELAEWAHPPTPLDLSLAVLDGPDGMMERPGKLISRANKVDGRCPCRQSGGFPGR
jgi:hypothetical protein